MTRDRRGYTLLELMVCLPLATLLIVGAGSSVYIASKASVQDTERIARREGAFVAHRLAQDLREATSFAVHSDQAAEFSVPDRDSDGVPETLRYAWSGTAGDPLTLCVNGSAPASLLPQVYQFHLDYVTKTAVPSPHAEEEVKLISHDDAPGGSLKDFKVDTGHPCAQYLLPTLPQGASKWSLSCVRLMAKTDAGTDGVVRLNITTATPQGKPSTTILSSATFREVDLGSAYAWVDVRLPKIENLDIGQGVCVVLKAESGGGGVAKIAFEENGAPMTPSTSWMTSGNGGATWTNAVDHQDMRFFAFGDFDAAPVERSFIIGTRGSLQVSATAELSGFATSILNAPEIE